MDRPGGPLPVCHCLDQVAGAKGYVSAGVDAWRRSDQRLGVNLDCSRRRELHSVLGFEEGQVWALPDRENAGVGLDGDDVLVLVLWGEAARSVEDRAHLPQVDGAQPPLADETLRSPTRQKLNALLASLLELLAALRGPQDGHLVERFERDDGDFGRAAAKRLASGVERLLHPSIGLDRECSGQLLRLFAAPQA